jgi:hypothetical protein
MAKTWCSEVVIWARDCKTGKVITEPPQEERWFRRTKAGPGRANRGQWTVTDEFNNQWKASIDANRPWRFKFRDCVDIVIWDRWPGRRHEMFETSVLTVLNKAFKLKDQISVMETTFNVYKKCLEEEEGPNGKRAREAKAILEDMRQFRLNRTSSEMKGKAAFLFYDEIDEQIDWAYGIYDNDPYWKRVDGYEVDNMYDISKKLSSASSQEEHNKLMKPYYMHVLRAALRPRVYKDDGDEEGGEEEVKLRLGSGKEVTYLGRVPEVQTVEDDGDEEWEDEDSDAEDDDEGTTIDEPWYEAAQEAQYFEEWATGSSLHLPPLHTILFLTHCPRRLRRRRVPSANQALSRRLPQIRSGASIHPRSPKERKRGPNERARSSKAGPETSGTYPGRHLLRSPQLSCMLSAAVVKFCAELIRRSIARPSSSTSGATT